MRSFQHVIVFLFALLTFALAQEAASYDATVYVTSTVYRVNTVTLSGTPTASIANSTSTISATAVSVGTGTLLPAYPTGNGTSNPTGTLSPSASTAAFPGAASHLNVNAFLAAVAAGIGYLAL